MTDLVDRWMLCVHRPCSTRRWVNDVWCLPVRASRNATGWDVENALPARGAPPSPWSQGYEPLRCSQVALWPVRAQEDVLEFDEFQDEFTGGDLIASAQEIVALYTALLRKHVLWIEDGLDVHAVDVLPEGATDQAEHLEAMLSLGFLPDDLFPGARAELVLRSIATRLRDLPLLYESRPSFRSLLVVEPDSAPAPSASQSQRALEWAVAASDELRGTWPHLVTNETWSEVLREGLENYQSLSDLRVFDITPPRRLAVPKEISFPEGWTRERS